MKYIVLLTILVFALSGCALPPTTAAAPAPEKAAEQSVPDQPLAEPVVASSEVTTTVALSEEVSSDVQVVLVPVEPKDIVLPVLGGTQIMPGWSMGDGFFSVPEGYLCGVTTDPYVLLQDGKVISEGAASVLIVGPGEYVLNTYVSPAGEVNAWPECASILSDNYIEMKRDQLSLNVGYLVGVVDLRSSAVVVAPVVQTAVVTETVVLTEVVPAPAEPAVRAEATIVTEEVIVSELPVCTPDSIEFVKNYVGEGVVTLGPTDKWILAGMDPAVINGQKPEDKAVVLVSPSSTVVVNELGRDVEGRAYIFACAFPGKPEQSVIDQWVDRESNNGSRQVEVILVGE